jgi:hypothetical protein
MVPNRVRITRIIAAILTFALSTQVADAQVVNCPMSSTQMTDDQGGMTQHQHRAHDPGQGVTRGGDSQDQSPGTARCSQTMLCANVAAVPTTPMRAFEFDNAEPQVSFGLGVPEARSLRPDPPPPRI